MSRRTDLEESIRASYTLIRQYEGIVRLSADPKERERARQTITEQWALIHTAVDERQRLGGSLPPDVAEIATHFGPLPLPAGPDVAPPAASEGKYQIHIEHAEGLVIGDGTQLEMHVQATQSVGPEPAGASGPARAVEGGDIYARYEASLGRLLAGLGQGHPRYPEALTLQQRLQENVAQARLYGDTETRRAERAEIVGHLNELALEAVGISFNELRTGAALPPTTRAAQSPAMPAPQPAGGTAEDEPAPAALSPRGAAPTEESPEEEEVPSVVTPESPPAAAVALSGKPSRPTDSPAGAPPFTGETRPAVWRTVVSTILGFVGVAFFINLITNALPQVSLWITGPALALTVVGFLLINLGPPRPRRDRQPRVSPQDKPATANPSPAPERPALEEPKIYLQEKSPEEVVARINSLNPLERDLVAKQTYVGRWVRWIDTVLSIKPFRFLESGGYTVTVGGGSFAFARLKFLPTEGHLVEPLREGDLISYEAKIIHVLDNDVYLTDVTLTRPEERSFADVPLEDLMRVFEEHTETQARTLVADVIGKWMRVSGPLGDVGDFTSFSQVTFAHRSPPSAIVYMYFRKKKWFDCLSVLNRGDNITVVGRIRDVRGSELHLDNCELVDLRQ